MAGLLDALGYVGSSLDKPGAAVRGLIGGQGMGALKNLIPFSDTMGLTSDEDKISGKDLLKQSGVLGQDDDSLMGTIGGAAVDTVTNPLTYLGPGALSKLGGMAGKAGGALSNALGLGGEAAGAVSPLLQARRGLSIAKDVNAAGQAGRIVGGSGASRQAAQTAAGWLAEDIPNGWGGMFTKVGDTPTIAVSGEIPAAEKLLTQRHELIHGLVDQAARSGNSQGMPALVKLAATVKGPGGAETGLRAGAGAILDELAAQSLENKGAWNQVQGGARFLFGGSPEQRAAYQGVFSKISPTVGRAYGALPYVPYAAGAAGAAGAGGGLLAALLGGGQSAPPQDVDPTLLSQAQR